MSEQLTIDQAKELIKHRIDLSQVISKHTKLIKHGPGYKALCPLPGHKEKSPSFHVNTRDQYFYCYGCQRGGDLFTFLDLVESRPFLEAVQDYSEQLGVELKKSSKGHKKEQGSQIKTGYELLTRAQSYFERVLWDGEGVGPKSGRDYLIQRKITTDEAKELGLGWAPEGWNTLCEKIKDPQELKIATDLRLVFKSQNGRYLDFFRSRLMIPIRDARGRTLGFSGRWLGEVSSQEPKYKNSSESEWFKKKHIVYGLDRSQQLIREHGFVCLVEGFFDQWAFQRRKIPSVAAMGVALSEEHADVLERFTKQIVMVLDVDAAGRNATIKNIPLLIRQGWDVKVFDELGGKDPDEWLSSQNIGHEKIKSILMSAPEALLWWAQNEIQESRKRGANLLQVYKQLGPIFAQCQSEAHRLVLSEELGRVLGQDRSEVWQALNSVSSSESSRNSFGNSFEHQRYQSRDSSKTFQVPTLNRLDMLARECLVWTIRFWAELSPKTHGEWEDWELLFSGTLADGLLHKMAAEWSRSNEHLSQIYLKELAYSDDVDEHLRTWLIRAFVEAESSAPLPRDKILKSFEELSRALRSEKIARQLNELRRQIENPATEPEMLARVLQEFQELRKKLENNN